MMQKYISVKQMAEMLNISLDTAYVYSHMPDFPSIKVGRIIRIPLDELEKWLKKRLVKRGA